MELVKRSEHKGGQQMQQMSFKGQSFLQWARSRQGDPAEWPKLGLPKFGLWEIYVFLQEKENSSTTVVLAIVVAAAAAAVVVVVVVVVVLEEEEEDDYRDVGTCVWKIVGDVGTSMYKTIEMWGLCGDFCTED